MRGRRHRAGAAQGHTVRGIRGISALSVLERRERWHPEQAEPGRRTRPDRAEALTRAAKYDRWVRAKVQTSRDVAAG